MNAVKVELTAEEAAEIVELNPGSPIAIKIQDAIAAEQAAEAKRVEAKRAGRRRNAENRKSKMVELKQKAAELDRLKASQGL